MLKKIFVAVLMLIVLGAAATGVYQFNQASAQAGVVPTSTAAQNGGYGQGGNSAQGNQVSQATQSRQTRQDPAAVHQLPAPGELSQEEADALLYMREEEKLARDVYTALYSIWKIPVFQNIAASEQAHMDSVKGLLDVYDLQDSAQAEAGVFTNPDLQALYDDLVARGSQSQAEALKVGGAIEEIDILDLQTRLAQTDNADIQRVFDNLLRGSYNHLRAFTKTLSAQTGETYSPQYMDAEAYNAAIGGSAQGGNGYGQQGGQSGQGYRGGQGGQGGKGQGGGRP